MIRSELNPPHMQLDLSNELRSGSWLNRLPLTTNWKISGAFARRHRWVFVGPCHLCVHGPPALRSFTSVQVLHAHTHTCSEQSLRILMWNASYVQKHSIKPDRKSMETRSEKNLEVCISTSLLDANRSLPDIKFGFKIVWKRHVCSWLSRLPLTKNWKIAGTFSQEHCSVFVGCWLQCSPAAPCLKWNEIMPTKIREV